MSFCSNMQTKQLVCAPLVNVLNSGSFLHLYLSFDAFGKGVDRLFPSYFFLYSFGLTPHNASYAYRKPAVY